MRALIIIRQPDVSFFKAPKESIKAPFPNKMYIEIKLNKKIDIAPKDSGSCLHKSLTCWNIIRSKIILNKIKTID